MSFLRFSKFYALELFKIAWMNREKVGNFSQTLVIMRTAGDLMPVVDLTPVAWFVISEAGCWFKRFTIYLCYSSETKKKVSAINKKSKVQRETWMRILREKVEKIKWACEWESRRDWNENLKWKVVCKMERERVEQKLMKSTEQVG